MFYIKYITNSGYYGDNKIKYLKFIDLDTIAYTEQKEVETYKDLIKEKYDIDFIPNIVHY